MRTDARAASTTDAAVPTMFAADPLVGLRPTLMAAAVGRLVRNAASHPAAVTRAGARLTGRLASVVAGRSDVIPERGDRRFVDDAWTSNPLYKRLGQGYLVAREEAYRLVRDVDLDDKSAERAEFAVGVAVEVLSPTNTVLNPAVVRQARTTAGRSLVQGARNLVDDVRHNGGMPSLVDRDPFSVGENVAVTPGRVVHRDDVLELIQYDPITEQVRERPVVLIPPQINKYYILDLAPGRSLIEHLVGQGQQVFAVSWRNPTARQREWDLDTYVQALLDALRVVTDITGSPDVNVAGACAGGITTASLVAYLGTTGSSLIHSATFLVTVLDMEADSGVAPFISRRAVTAALRRSQRRGVLKGSELARVFAWLRPNDLVCNYWVNNWLMGRTPPAFDILFWNADVTNLPAGLHADYLGMSQTNPFVEGSRLEVLGVPVDLKAFAGDTYVVAGLTDHITPWESCYRTIDLVGGDVEFVLSNSGHVQALVNPPGNPKARYVVGDEGGAHDVPADVWRKGAHERQGTWWDHWGGWLAQRSGAQVDAPGSRGSTGHPPSDLAPGRYVHNL